MNQAPSSRPSRKRREPSPGVVAAKEAARALVARLGVTCAEDIHVTRIAQGLGATVVYRDTFGADGRIVSGGERSLICVDEWARGTPRGRWTIAHELAHLLLHAAYDALDRIHGSGPKSGRDRQIEREADAFAVELLMPSSLFAPRCCAERPTIETLDALAEEYGTSLTSTGKRYAELATSACAMLECRAGRIARATRSASFRGVAKERRALEEGTAAHRVWRAGERGERKAAAAAERVTGGVWGSGKLGVEMTEHAIPVAESGVLLVWLWHAGVAASRG